MGSSPQVRGPLSHILAATQMFGLIPAGAGTTVFTVIVSRSRRAHPRRCGDHFNVLYLGLEDLGSSPQVRGPRQGVRSTLTAVGLIPAGAGTTLICCKTFWQRWAHPRRCGDHFSIAGLNDAVTGSSPQVRGPRSRWNPRNQRCRLIPAGAGTTHTRCS